MYSERSKLHCPINPPNLLDWQLRLKRYTSGQKLVKGYYSVPITAGFIPRVFLFYYFFIVGSLFLRGNNIFPLGFTISTVGFLIILWMKPLNK